MNSQKRLCEYCSKEIVNTSIKQKKFRKDKRFCNQKCHDAHKHKNASKAHNEFRRQYGLNKYTLKGIVKKLQLIKLFGGKCEICGYNKNISGFDFHHKNPDEKSFEIKVQVLNYLDDDLILQEAEKCMLLCANCHRELHNPYMDIEHVEEVLALIDYKF